MVGLRGFHKTASRYFALSASLIPLWAVGDILLLTSKTPVGVRAGVVLFAVAPMFTALFLLLFSKSFPDNRKVSSVYKTSALAVTLLLGATIVVFPEFLFSEVQVNTNGYNSPVTNFWGYGIYTLYFSAFFGTSYWNLFRAFLKHRGYQKYQSLYSFVGITLTSGLATVTNLAMPLFVSSDYIWLGPVFTIFYVSTTTVAIVRHRLFDIRLIVARSLAYTLLLATLATTYGLALFAASGIFFPNQAIGQNQRLLNVVLAILLAFTFQPLRRFFEKLTDKIFYHDKYDSQQVLNNLGNVFASQIDINIIIESSLGVLSEAIKPTHSLLVVLDEEKIYRQVKVGDAPSSHISVADLKHLHNNLYLADELEHGFIKTFLDAHDMSAVLRLVTQEGVVGFVFLGPKQSGTIYTSQDAQLLETAGPALAVAVQNARSFEKIADFNLTLQKRVTEATHRLRIQNARLKELDEAKDSFISMASHQLRTPLTAIKGYLSMLLEGDAGKLDKKQHEFADLAFMSSERMVFLIADMLNVSRIQTGKLMIEKGPVDLEELVHEEISQLERTAASRGVVLKFSPPTPKLPVVSLDEGKMRQVIMNFMDNAIYYAPNSNVEIALEQQAGKVRYTVRDHGIGVPKEAQEHLFTKFYRAGNAQKARPDGTGLGLYMAKMVVEMQGGSIIFESQEGKGSTFGFEFPLDEIIVKEPAAAKAAVPVSELTAVH